MSRYCLDTSAYSHLRRGIPNVVGIVDSAEWIGVPTVVIGELWSGFLAGGRRERNRSELDEFLSHPLVEELAVDREVAMIYGEIHRELRAAGTPVPTNDIWVAATAAFRWWKTASAGVVSLTDARRVPHAERSRVRVRDCMAPVSSARCIAPEASLKEALERMTGQNLERLLVVQGGALVGMITLSGLSRVVETRSLLDEQ